MFGLGATELIIIFLIILVIFGAKKLPEIGSGLGKGITNSNPQVVNSKPDPFPKVDQETAHPEFIESVVQ